MCLFIHICLYMYIYIYIYVYAHTFASKLWSYQSCPRNSAGTLSTTSSGLALMKLASGLKALQFKVLLFLMLLSP